MDSGGKIAAVAITLWVGALWSIGYIAAPTLFMALSDRSLAGMLAGKMFTVVAFIGMAAGPYLLIHRLVVHGAAAMKQVFFWVVFAMLALTLIGYFGIQPVIESLRVEGGPAHVMRSMTASRFQQWHGIASFLYLIESLLGLVLVLRSK